MQNEKSKFAKRGFASMDENKLKEIARKGGQSVSQNREYMAEIGRRGGIASGKQRKK